MRPEKGTKEQDDIPWAAHAGAANRVHCHAFAVTGHCLSSFYLTSASSVPASYAQWGKVRGQTCSLSYSYIMILPFYTLSRTLSRPLGPCISGIIQLGTRTVAWCFMLRYNINVFVRWPACVENMDVVI